MNIFFVSSKTETRKKNNDIGELKYETGKINVNFLSTLIFNLEDKINSCINFYGSALKFC